MPMIWRAVQTIGWCFAIAVALVALFLALQKGPAGPQPLVEYKDFVSILLTAIAVMIAVGAVIAAFAAIWGFDLLRREIVKTATDTATKVATDAATARVDALVPGLVEKAQRL